MKIAIVGAGFSGATVAAILSKVHDVTVFDARYHVGGNCHTERDPETGIMLHKYGPHIFHTADPAVRLVRGVIWLLGAVPPSDEIYCVHPGVLGATDQPAHDQPSVPASVSASRRRRSSSASSYTHINIPHNFEEAALASVGEVLYTMFMKEYTRKQWGRDPREIPASVYSRLPLNFTYDDGKYPAYRVAGDPGRSDTPPSFERMLAGS